MKTRWPIGIAGALVVVAVVAAVWLKPRKRATEPDIEERAEVLSADPVDRPERTDKQPVPAESSIQRQVRAAVDRAASVTDKTNLSTYLDSLLARARAQGRITPMEAVVGNDLITRLGGDFETRIKFSTQLNALAEELRQGAATPAATGVEPPQRLNEIAASLRDERDETKRQDLIRQYTDRASALEPEERIRALSALNDLAGAPTPQQQQSTAVSLAAQWAAIEGAPGPDQQAAIRALLETVRRLPPEEQIQQIQRLNQITHAGQPTPP